MRLLLVMTFCGIVFSAGCFDKMSQTIEDPSAGFNGDFEISRSGLPVNWMLYTPETVPNADFDLTIDTEEFMSGNQSLKFVVRQCFQTGGWHSPGFARELVAEPGTRYKLSFWIKNSGCEFLFVAGGISEKGGEYGVNARVSESTTEWEKKEYEFRMPAAYEKLRLQLNITTPGKFWIDNLKIEKIESEAAE